MIPRGTVILWLRFTDPVLTKPRARLRRQQRLFSKQKGRDIPRSSELNINVRLWTRMLGSGQLLGLNRTPASGSATFNPTAAENLPSSHASPTDSVMGREGRYHPLNTSMADPRTANASTQVTNNRSSLTLAQLASRVSSISSHDRNSPGHHRPSTAGAVATLPRTKAARPHYITVRSPAVPSMTVADVRRRSEQLHFIFVPCPSSPSILSDVSTDSGLSPQRTTSFTLPRKPSLEPSEQNRRVIGTKVDTAPAGIPTITAFSPDNPALIIDQPPTIPSSVAVPCTTTQSISKPSSSFSSEHTRTPSPVKESNDLSTDNTYKIPSVVSPNIPDYDIVPSISGGDTPSARLSTDSTRFSDYATPEPGSPEPVMGPLAGGEQQHLTDHPSGLTTDKSSEPDYVNLRDVAPAATESPVNADERDADSESSSAPVAPPRRSSRFAPSVPVVCKVLLLVTLVALKASGLRECQGCTFSARLDRSQ
ncbi:unnamed protein product [Echinostoma caproni]|uniref:Uncharacterized protein n=1 Tax=Echinostoma caproni TaxID=27848 RepID=A0A183AV22_9TREM|nr:unnamed protein product [Echinostoma caproni]